MKNRLVKMSISFLLTALLVIGSSCSSTQSNPPTESGVAPDFSWKDEKGTLVKLSDLKGYVVILDFWATWCGPCKDTIPHIEAIYEEFQGTNLIVLGIDTFERATQEEVQQFVQKNGMKYLIVQDKDNKVAAKYGVTGIPRIFVINKEGRISKTIIGYDPEMKNILKTEIEKLLKE